MKKMTPRITCTLFVCALVLCACSHSVLAQSLKDKYVSLSYQSYPENPLPSYVKSYAIIVKGFYEKDEIIKKKVTDAIDLKNLTEVADASTADAVIELTIQKLAIKKKEEKKETVETVTNYWYEVMYTLPTTVLIYNKDKSFYLRNEKMFDTETKIETGRLSSGGLVLENYYSDNSLKFICIENSLSVLKTKLAADYSFNRAELMIDLYTAKGKKINYDDLDNAASQVKDALKKTDITGEPSAAQKTLLESAIAAWQKALAEADTTNASARINKSIYYGIHFNLALTNAWTGNFDKAWTHYKLANHFGSNTTNAANLRTFAKWLKTYESGWMMNHIDKAPDVLRGTWKVTAISSRNKLDLNKDGNSSTNVLDEYERCKKDQVYEFGENKKLTITIGKEESCKKIESVFWRIAKNSKEEKNYMLWDSDSEGLSFSDAGGIFKVMQIGYTEFTIKGDALIDRGSDTTDEISMTFTRL